MLHMYILSNAFYYFGQCGVYLDFIIKKLAEKFIRNLLIVGAQIFSEKYIIEFLTKTIFENFFSFLSNMYNQSNFSQELFFFNVIGSIFIFLILFQIIFFIV